jgi:hypothetical protein
VRRALRLLLLEDLMHAADAQAGGRGDRADAVAVVQLPDQRVTLPACLLEFGRRSGDPLGVSLVHRLLLSSWLNVH